MKFKGGYNIALKGRPSSEIQTLPEPGALYLPLRTGRFGFSEICVEEGRRVKLGEVLARDPGNYSVPLLAPRAGVVRLQSAESHIVLEDIAKDPQEPDRTEEEAPQAARAMGERGILRYKLLRLGAWQFFYDAYTGALPDPYQMPQAVIVSAMNCEPYLAGADVQILRDLEAFARGLGGLESIVKDRPIYLFVPDIESEFTERLREKGRDCEGVRVIEIPSVYPNDNFAVLARRLELKRDKGAVWAMRAEGVLAVEKTLNASRPCVERIISVAGPAVEKPGHIETVYGYPLGQILHSYVNRDDVRIINGGVFTGQAIGPGRLGIDSECTGLTVLPESTGREFMAFARAGLQKQSYSRWCFLGGLRGRFEGALTTAVQGEERACVSCNYCEEVCPVGIMPHVIHKFLYKDDLDEAERARVDLCVGCGLCSYVCPSKIELAAQFADAQDRIRSEHQSGGAAI